MTRSSKPRPRTAARELVLQALYQWQLAGHGLDELLRQFSQREEYQRVDPVYFKKLLTDILADNEAFTALIEEYAHRSPGHLDPLGRAALLIGLAELKLRPDVPTKVVINEAVELAKRYGPTDGHRFVSAVLDRAAGTLDERKKAAGPR